MCACFVISTNDILSIRSYICTIRQHRPLHNSPCYSTRWFLVKFENAISTTLRHVLDSCLIADLVTKTKNKKAEGFHIKFHGSLVDAVLCVTFASNSIKLSGLLPNYFHWRTSASKVTMRTVLQTEYRSARSRWFNDPQIH